jgi:hypothetical protein
MFGLDKKFMDLFLFALQERILLGNFGMFVERHGLCSLRVTLSMLKMNAWKCGTTITILAIHHSMKISEAPKFSFILGASTFIHS